MRALGPGSVSSFLKIALDVAYWALWAVTVGFALLALSLLLYIPFAPEMVHVRLGAGLGEIDADPRSPALAGFVLACSAYTALMVVILNRLRRVVETLTLGDPFQPENVQRLRQIGLALIGVEAMSHLARLTLRLWMPRSAAEGGWVVLNPTALFSVLAVFVLAEVFREGARLRAEAELTV